MSNLETTESKNTVKHDLAGSIEELIEFLLELGNKTGSIVLEVRGNDGRKLKYTIKWLGFLCSTLRIIEHDEAAVMADGTRRINDLRPENVLMDRDYLDEVYGILKAKLSSGVWLTTMGETVDPDSVEFQAKFNAMCDFPAAHLEELMQAVKKIINSLTTKDQHIEPEESDFLASPRFIQAQQARAYQLVLRDEAMHRRNYMAMLSKPYKSKAEIDELAKKIEIWVYIARIVNKESKDVVDRNIIGSVMASVIELDNGISEKTKQNIRTLNRRIQETHDLGRKLSASRFLMYLSDCFAEKDLEASQPTDKHHAFMAQPTGQPKAAEDRKRKYTSEQPSKEQYDKKPSTQGDASQQATIEFLVKTMTDLKSTVGQLSSLVRDDRKRENVNPNRNRYGEGRRYSDKRRSPEKRRTGDKHYANTATQPKKKSKKSVKTRHSSDSSDYDSDEYVQPKAYLARPASGVRGSSSTQPKPEGQVFDLYGRRPNDLDSDDDGPPPLEDSDDEDEGLPPLVPSDSEAEDIGWNNGESGLPAKEGYQSDASIGGLAGTIDRTYIKPESETDKVNQVDVLFEYSKYQDSRKPAVIMDRSAWIKLDREVAAYWSSFAKIVLQDRSGTPEELYDGLIYYVTDSDLLVKRLYDLILETDDDDLLTKYASTIRDEWHRLMCSIPEHYETALQNLLSRRRQGLLMSAGLSNDKSLHGSLGKWVCTTPTEELFSGSQLTGYYCTYQPHLNYQEKVFYGQSNELPEIKVLQDIAISDANPKDKACVLEEDQQTADDLVSLDLMNGVELNDLPKCRKDVTGKRHDLPAETPPVQIGLVQDHPVPSITDSGMTEYIPDIVVSSPTGQHEGRQLRPRSSIGKPDVWRPPRIALANPRIALTSKPARRAPPPRRSSAPALVLPEPVTDFDSETDSTPVSPPGRQATSTTTDRA